MTEQASLYLTWLDTQKTGFLMIGLQLRLFDQLLWGFGVMWNQFSPGNVVTHVRKGHRKLDLIIKFNMPRDHGT